MTNQTNHTDENNMDNAKNLCVGIIIHIIGSLVIATIIILSFGLFSFWFFSCSNNYANNYARFSIDGVTVTRNGELVDVQWHLTNNNRRISVDEAINLGFEKNEDGYFAIPISHFPTSSPGNSWVLREVVPNFVSR